LKVDVLTVGNFVLCISQYHLFHRKFHLFKNKANRLGYPLGDCLSPLGDFVTKKYGHPDDGGESHFPEAFFQTKSWRPKLGRLAKNQQVFIISNRPILVRVWQYICM
jgi:hypothetical protein